MTVQHLTVSLSTEMERIWKISLEVLNSFCGSFKKVS